jgi:hypothetical protein
LSNTHSLAFETKPFYSLKLSLEKLQKDEVYQLIKKVSSKYKSGINPKKFVETFNIHSLPLSFNLQN